MAIGKNGLHGWPSGKIGRIVYYELNGQPVMRSIGKAGKPSLKQQANHQAMAVTTRFLSHLKDFINNGFELETRGTIRNQHNLAVSQIKKNALKGAYPNINIDYEKVELSKGTLIKPKDLQMEKIAEGLQISWDSAYSYGTGAQYDDTLQLAVCFPATGKKTIELNFAKRKDGTAFLPLSEEELLQPMEVYLFLRAANHDSVSDTVYLGNLNGTYEDPKITEFKEKKRGLDLQFNLRYEQITTQYEAQMKLKPAERLSGKVFRNLETEYLVLQDQWRSRQAKTSGF
ncbi:hypothetical protein H9X96_07215 [Pedobacter sp. N36a]|uniref:DUF6266 family protein n=1 Tax=Pedobacter sp. N36a TaxID=2767996 RepID=UPI001656FFE6|nr:DUF6266 family protein [Pedobacter sp. N36a]MBC8985562.1 hypothetical protein [Pedobacter sp. N36a]